MVGKAQGGFHMMSQLLTQFFASVHEFNNCKTAAHYKNLKRFYDRSATAYEVDPPNNPHGLLDPQRPAGVDGNQLIVDYLANTQPALWPRFWPSLPTITETPANSDDTAIAASLDGSATYFDCTTNPPPLGANTTPFVINFHFEFKRPDPGSLWLVTLAVGKRVR
jgi:hypothetical protein